MKIKYIVTKASDDNGEKFRTFDNGNTWDYYFSLLDIWTNVRNPKTQENLRKTFLELLTSNHGN